jgi:hypothetical protein
MKKYLAGLVWELLVCEGWGRVEEALLPEHGELLTHGNCFAGDSIMLWSCKWLQCAGTVNNL